ncbi:unnamed protein product [Auanema sp. JU1783]|nr:unnamed protein product [Auanema sp. JU1783]
MYRGRSNDDQDNSDDECSRMPHRHDSDDDGMSSPKKKRANNVWSDVLIEQSLESKSSSFNLNSDPSTQMINRGAETYDVPSNLLKPELELLAQNPIVAVTPASDDPFADPVDLSSVEGFGVRGNDSRGRRNGGRGRGGFNRGRGRGNGAQTNGNKRRYQPNTKNATLSNDYSLEALMATEFTDGLSLDELGKEMALALGENDPEALMKIVNGIGSEKALAIFDETRQVESSGGMKVLDGSRRRTPGGVFIMLVKSDMDIEPELKDEIFQHAKQVQRKTQRAHRRKGVQKKTPPSPKMEEAC